MILSSVCLPVSVTMSTVHSGSMLEVEKLYRPVPGTGLSIHFTYCCCKVYCSATKDEKADEHKRQTLFETVNK